MRHLIVMLRLIALLSLVVMALSAQAATVRILFLGNSHTSYNNIAGTVKSMIESDGTGNRAYVETRIGAFLEDLATNQQVLNTIKNGKWNYVIFQGAKLSSSHQYNYSQDGAIAMAKLAIASGAKAMLYAEWPRRGWNETNYILGVYNKIAAASGASIIPVCRSWDIALAKYPKVNLWMSDGNHANALGGYLASASLYLWLAGDKATPRYVPAGVNGTSASQLFAIAREAYQRFGK